MEPVKRSAFQGVTNIVRFNWHFYALALFFITLLLFAGKLFPQFIVIFLITAGLIFLPILVSLLISYYIYDLSGLYELRTLDDIDIEKQKSIVNINAGFDETSAKLVEKFTPSYFQALDFYDPAVHTEVSIKRARRAGLIYPNTISITTNDVPLDANSIDYIFLIFSLHEVRNQDERIEFVRILKSKLTQGGKIIVIEHLRDLPNFIPYTVGFFHFYSRKTWLNNFKEAKINLVHSSKLNPFVHIFVLQ